MDPSTKLVKAYLELCGYFVLAPPPIRGADHAGYVDATDLEVIAVRFPHASRDLVRGDTRPLDLFMGSDPILEPFDGVDVLVGEVREGAAGLNPSLRRAQTVAFALRRVGCCRASAVEGEAWRVVEQGSSVMPMPGGLPCRVRQIAFAGRGIAAEHGALTISLNHCAKFVAYRLEEGREVLAGAQFMDSVRGLIALHDRISDQGSGWTDGRAA